MLDIERPNIHPSELSHPNKHQGRPRRKSSWNNDTPSNYVYVSYRRKDVPDEEVCVIAYEDDLKKWRQNPSVIPLTEVLDSFDIFKYQGGGVQGISLHVNRQVLSKLFGELNDDEIIRTILRDGESRRIKHA